MDHPWIVKMKIILEKECIKSLSSWNISNAETHCTGTVDSFGGCWNHTLPEEMRTITCPSLLSTSPKGFATRKCMENGTWARADYSNCKYLEDQKEFSFLPVYIFTGGYLVSIIFLIISLVIFFGFRQLRCGRVTIHKNLFLSYIFTGLTWISYNIFVALKGQVLLDNPPWCQCLHILAQYFIVCNFSWMFCEGLYLHTILLKAFSAGKSLLIACGFIGWVFPLFPTTTYAVIRFQYGDTSQCWISESSLQWIMFGPIVLSLVVNICFLVNIVRLLMTKLRQIPDAQQTKKAARATLVLIPLLGIQYLLVPMRPEKDSVFEDIYLYLTAILISLQGAFVSIIYCFCNGEVVAIFKRRWNQHLMMHSNRGSRQGGVTMTTYSVTEQYIKDDENVKIVLKPLNGTTSPC